MNTAIPAIHKNLAISRVAVGAAGEQIVAQALEKRGYVVEPEHHKGDLSVITPDGEIYHVEVKTARRGTDGKYRFTLYKQGSQNHRKSDICLLLCVLKTGEAIPFVVPTSCLLGQNQAVITSYPKDYTGKLAVYRQSMRKLSIEQAVSAYD